jgi:CBS domain-containing protein
MTSSSPRLVHLPIRSLETLVAGGKRVHNHSVPCPMRGGSVDVATCRVCPHLAGMDGTGAEAGVVSCTPDVASGRGARVGGCTLAHAVPSVRDDVTLQELTSFFVQQGAPRVAVVDEAGTLVGTITERDLIVGDILAYRRLSDVPAASLARQAHAVSESTTLRDALRRMAHHQLREIPVVSESGQFTGWLEDLEALRTLRLAT